MKSIFILCALSLTGCCVGDEQCAIANDLRVKTGEMRKDIFENCMLMASKIERVGDDDVSDIISECDSVSYYQSTHIIN